MTRKRDIRMIDEIVRKLRLSREQRDLLHRAVHGQRMTYREILEEAKAILEDYPSK